MRDYPLRPAPESLYFSHRTGGSSPGTKGTRRWQALSSQAYQRIIEARERQVSRYVNDALLSLDDKTLESMAPARRTPPQAGNRPVF